MFRAHACAEESMNGLSKINIAEVSRKARVWWSE